MKNKKKQDIFKLAKKMLIDFRKNGVIQTTYSTNEEVLHSAFLHLKNEGYIVCSNPSHSITEYNNSFSIYAYKGIYTITQKGVDFVNSNNKLKNFLNVKNLKDTIEIIISVKSLIISIVASIIFIVSLII